MNVTRTPRFALPASSSAARLPCVMHSAIPCAAANAYAWPA
jgi:hypothetical protein